MAAKPAPGAEAAVAAELDQLVARLLFPLCAAVAALYTTYVLILPLIAPADLVNALRPTWAAGAVIFAAAAVALRYRRVRAPWGHPLLAGTAALVLTNSLRLVHIGGPLFTNVLILVMVAYATLALSIPWTIAIVGTTVAGWTWIAANASPDPAWKATGVMLVSGAAIALLVQALRLDATRHLIQLRKAQLEAEEQRHQEEERRVRVELVNMAAHELATPLTPITIHLHALRSAPELPAPYQDRVRAMERSLERLRGGIETIKELAEAGSEAGIAREPVDLGEVVREAVADVSSWLQAGRITLEAQVAERFVVPLDRRRVRLAIDQVLQGLGGRLPQGGRIRLSLERATEGVRLTFSGEEAADGVGPTTGEKATPRPARDPPMGFSVARRIVEAHGGTFQTEETTGAGPTVRFRLPG